MASIVRRPDGKWRARYRDDDGREHSKHFARRANGQRWIDQVTSSLVTGQYVDRRLGSETLRDYSERWRSAQPHRPGTAKAVEQHLRCYVYPVLGARRITSLRHSDIQAWVTGVASRVAPSTTKTIFNTAQAVIQAAVRDRVIAANPCDGVVLPKVPRKRIEPLTVEQVRTLIEATPVRYRALVVLAAGSGLRAGELFGLQVRHVDFLRRTLTVEQQVQQLAGHEVYVCPPKTQSSYRTLPLPQSVLDALAEHLLRHPAEQDGFLFSSPTGGPVVRTSFMDTVWRPAAKAAGVPKGQALHALRHFYASALIRAGLSVRVVSDRLGHANAAMTLNVYAHLWPDDEDRTREALESIFRVDEPPDTVSVRT